MNEDVNRLNVLQHLFGYRDVAAKQDPAIKEANKNTHGKNTRKNDIDRLAK